MASFNHALGTLLQTEAEKLAPMQSALANLKLLSTVVADTGEFDLVEKYLPEDSTTNPSLILGAMSKPEYAHLISDAVTYAKSRNLPSEAETLSLAADKLFVNFGIELLKRIPGRVSTEVDARLSFDTKATIERALRIINLYEDAGIIVGSACSSKSPLHGKVFRPQPLSNHRVFNAT